MNLIIPLAASNNATYILEAPINTDSDMGFDPLRISE